MEGSFCGLPLAGAITIQAPVRPSGGMVDAGDSKSPDGNIVRVRISPRAPPSIFDKMKDPGSVGVSRGDLSRVPELVLFPFFILHRIEMDEEL